MPSLVASGTAPKGIWTPCFTTTATTSEFVLVCPDIPKTRPIPCFWFAELYEDVLNTNELIWVRNLAQGNRCTYFFSDKPDQSIYFYAELNSPLTNPLTWEIWQY